MTADESLRDRTSGTSGAPSNPAPPESHELGLLEKQKLFTKLLAQIILWVYDQGWELTLADGSVDPIRKFLCTDWGITRTLRGRDQQHMADSLHYERLAQDLNLFVKGVWMKSGCPEWQAIGAHWKTLNPLCRWGGDFASVDLNHLSLTEGGKA